jgi:predicted nucleic acid-binding protein
MHEIAAPDDTTAMRTFKSHFMTQYQIVLMTTVLVDRAMELAEKHRLRGYDATQLASALVSMLSWLPVGSASSSSSPPTQI